MRDTQVRRASRPRMLKAALMLTLAGGHALALERARPPRATPPRPAQSGGGGGSGCTTWTGSSRGNAGFSVVAVLCSAGDRVTGTIRFAHPSGSSTLRGFEGEWTDGRGRMVLRQTGVVREQVAPSWRLQGWRWCPSNTVYEFRPSGRNQLAGSYDSPGCDRGTLTLSAEGRNPG